jgi:hypothetical protein
MKTRFTHPDVTEDELKDSVMEQFHKLWGQCHDGIYNKKEWGILQNLLEEDLRMGIAYRHMKHGWWKY